jgi:hypothetical protein
MNKKLTEENLARIFEEHNKAEVQAYLNDLRDSGECNMFGCGTYLQEEFDMSRRDGTAVATQYMQDGLEG